MVIHHKYPKELFSVLQVLDDGMWFPAIIDGYVQEENQVKHKVKYNKKSWMRVHYFVSCFVFMTMILLMKSNL